MTMRQIHTFLSRTRLWVVWLLSFSAFNVHAEMVRSDTFLSTNNVGTVGILFENVQDKKNAIRVVVVRSGQVENIKRRKTCWMVFAHKNDEFYSKQSFFGVQIVKVFKDIQHDGVVHVGRNNSKWLSRIDSKLIQAIRPAKEVSRTTFQDFAGGHGGGGNPEDLLLIDGRRLSETWHARLGQGSEALDTRSEEHRRFWSVNPAAESEFHGQFKSALDAGAKMRMEGHLLSFVVANSNSLEKIPDLRLDCNDSYLIGFAVRVYAPLRVDPTTWHFVRFD